MEIRIYIHNGKQLLEPALADGIDWVTERKGVPGKLSFSVLQDDALEITEGNAVVLQADGTAVFRGFIFRISRNESPTVQLTAYDQLRYLKNKDVYVFDALKASEIIAMIGADYGISMGEIADTGYVIPSAVEDNVPLIDMMQGALDATLQNTRRMYVLYDDAGRLCLKNAAQMHVGLIIDGETARSYAYDSDIDEETYNRVKLVHEDEDGARSVTVAEDATTQAQWGTLQLTETISELENAQARAEMMLELYNVKKRSLKLKGVLGDLRVRAGCFVIVRLSLADRTQDGFMLVEVCRHSFVNGMHSMDLTLRGGDFGA